ncbi:MAG TPA: Fe-S-containing protein [Candidatus Polarisedimenticolia bacterium]|nr:Fe-S-containing protein [Candidatus Polarisedimenticolia bacterium]
MFEALVITLREGIEAALVVGIILGYLERSGRSALRRPVFAGLFAGIAASLGCAWLFSAMGLEEERWEGWLMLLGAFFVVSMVVWMWRTAKGLKRAIETRVEAAAARPGPLVGAALATLTFFLVLREGVETVLFLAAVNLTTDALLAFAGGLAGLALAVGFGVAFVRGSVRIDLGRFFMVTEIVLLVLAAQLLIGGIHELAELGVIAIGRTAMTLVGPIVKNDALVIASLLALPLIALLVPGRRDRERSAEAAALEGPERRLALAAIRRDTLWRRVLAIAGLFVIGSLTLSYAFTRLPRGIDPPRVLSIDDPAGDLRLPIAGLDDGHLHRFGVSIDGTVVRFIVMKSHGKVVPTFDACVVCGAHGYVERQGRLVCLACAADINTATLGTGGGCNPIPLKHRIEDGVLVIGREDLKAERAAFAAVTPGDR